jgi:hypothetical protein
VLKLKHVTASSHRDHGRGGGLGGGGLGLGGGGGAAQATPAAKPATCAAVNLVELAATFFKRPFMLTPNALTVRDTVRRGSSCVLGMTAAPFKYTSVKPPADIVTAKCVHALAGKLTLKDGVDEGVLPLRTVT